MADISICFLADPRELHGVRSTLAGWLAGQGVSGPDSDELVLIASELATNAIQASRGPESEVRVTAWREGELIALEVDDDGGGFDESQIASEGRQPKSRTPPPASATRGRGLPIVEAIVDVFEVHRHGARTIVHIERTLAPTRPFDA